MRLSDSSDLGASHRIVSRSLPRARSLGSPDSPNMPYPRQEPSSSTASSRPSSSASASFSGSATFSSAPEATSTSSSGNTGGAGPVGMSSPASGSLNSTRIVLGRGFANGQLTYTVPLTAANQQVNAQLDTGSGDLWLANQDCASDSCKGHQGLSVVKFNDHLDSVVDQDTPFNISYLLGSASGKVKTASMLFGDPITSRLIINSQAFGSCSTVNNEDMDSGNFSGIIGFGPPANSLIQADLNATSNTASINVGVRPPDTGAVLAGFWNYAPPGRRFVGIGLQRLEEDGGQGDSVLTIGNHDPVYAGNATNPQISYTPAIADADGVVRHWRVPLTDISVLLQHGITEPIPIGTSSVITGSNPIAIFDSGASVNLGPESTLNALYGAWGIGPASDGGYYVPCDLQMNITLGLGGVEIPIHPLDASLQIGAGNGPSYQGGACLGSFQALRSLSGSSTGSNLNSSFLPADFVLSPAFMRSAYTVFSCDGGLNTTQALAANMTTSSPCQAAVGLRSLVNMTLATQQFTAVRVKKQTLGQSGLHGGGYNNNSNSSSTKGLSGGIKVVIGCVCAIVVIAVLFGVALWRLRRRRRRIAAARAALLASQAEKSRGGVGGNSAGYDGSAGHSKKQSNPYSTVKIDGLNVPMEILGKDDDDSSQVILSAAQRAKTRQLHHIHGVYDEELNDDEAGQGMGPQWGEEVNVNKQNLSAAGLLSWDVSSTGYADARQVKNAYLASLSEEERKAFLEASSKRQDAAFGQNSIHAQLQSLDERSVQLSQSQSQVHARTDSNQSSAYPNSNDRRTSSPGPLLQNDELR